MNKSGKRCSSVSTHNVLLEHIFNKLHAPLFFYALKFTDNLEVAKDLVQDAFLGTINRNVEIQNLKVYLYQSARSNCLISLKHCEVISKYIQKEQECTKSQSSIDVGEVKEESASSFETDQTTAKIQNIIPKIQPCLKIKEGIDVEPFVSWKNNVLEFKKILFEKLQGNLNAGTT
jgi:hypothetical protein